MGGGGIRARGADGDDTNNPQEQKSDTKHLTHIKTHAISFIMRNSEI